MPATHADLFALTTDLIDMVFPLARESDPRLSLEGWRNFAIPRAATDRSMPRLPGVLLAARNNNIRGLAAYDVSAATAPDRVLNASRIVIIDRTRDRNLVLDLLGGLLRIAEGAQCARVCAELSPSSRWLQTRWSDPGGQVFRLPVECSTLPAMTRVPPATGVVSLRLPG